MTSASEGGGGYGKADVVRVVSRMTKYKSDMKVEK